MKSVKINKNRINVVLNKLDVDFIEASDVCSIVHMESGCCHGLSVGDLLSLRRYKCGMDAYDNYKTLDLSVTEVVDDFTFKTQKIENGTFIVKNVTRLNDGWYSVVLNENPGIQGADVDYYAEKYGGEYLMMCYDPNIGRENALKCDRVVSVFGDITKNLYDYGILENGEPKDAFYVFDGNEIYEGMTVEFPFNAFFYYDENGNGLLWNNSTLYHNNSFFNLSVPFSVDEEYRNMYQDVLVKDKYVNDTILSLSSEPIDMEKIKYSPVYFSDGVMYKATGLTFNFHFRERQLKYGLSDAEENVIYDDGWYIKSGTTGWNNGFGNYTDIYSSSNADKLAKSDLLSYLDFTDNDVEMRKKKVSKSFMRLSYYNATDPVDQSLLFYSTSFLDGGTLFGRYIKKKRAAFERHEQWDKRTDPKHIIKQEGETEAERVSSQITITDEYDLTKSSEGFNLYLFAEDAPEKWSTGEIPVKTIYMKVEFNHAGYGRTIPFVVWPKKNGNADKVTIENYLNDVIYIPVEIAHIDDDYVYFFNSISDQPGPYGIFVEDGNININLFEPKLDASD